MIFPHNLSNDERLFIFNRILDCGGFETKDSWKFSKTSTWGDLRFVIYDEDFVNEDEKTIFYSFLNEDELSNGFLFTRELAYWISTYYPIMGLSLLKENAVKDVWINVFYYISSYPNEVIPSWFHDYVRNLENLNNSYVSDMI